MMGRKDPVFRSDAARKCPTCGGLGLVVNPEYEGTMLYSGVLPDDYWVQCPECAGWRHVTKDDNVGRGVAERQTQRP